MDLYSIRQRLNMGESLTNMKLRVTYYSRVSTYHEEQRKSLKNQIDHFSDMINSNNNWIFVQGYVDEGISGTTDVKRDNFMKMIEDAKNNLFDLIITKEISRFSRNTLDSISYTRKLLSYGVAVLFVNDNINTALPDSELRLTIMACMAQDEIRRLSERVKFGMNRAILNGNILGNDMMYGYKKDKNTGKLCIVKKEKEVIEDIFYQYVIENKSINSIVKYLNQKNIKTRRNNKWCISSISRIIKNPKYKGFYCGKKSEVIDYMSKKVKQIPKEEWIIYKDSNKVPPIIDEYIWELANKKLNQRNYNNKEIYKNRYVLSAKIYCGNDFEVFHRRKQCKNDISWVCAKKLIEGKKYCDSINIRESEIYYIFDDIIDILIDFNEIKKILYLSYNKEININFNNLKLRDDIIDLLLNKIIIKNNNLDIYLNISAKRYSKIFVFERGNNTIKYSVNIK